MFINCKSFILRFLFVLVFNSFNLISCTPFMNTNVNNITKIVNNRIQNTWKAGYIGLQFVKTVKHLVGVLPRKKLSLTDILQSYDLPNPRDPLPESYDVTLNWPMCESVISIRDQSHCGSCWALATASSFGDRLCIATNTTINKVLSGEYINSCCKGGGCNGGHPEKAWKFIKKNGICTGGEYDSNEGCQPYSIPPCPRITNNDCSVKNGATPRCSKTQCTNTNYEIPLSSDLYYATKVYSVRPKTEVIMNEIYTNGPVVAAMKVYDDFLYYQGGIYQYVTGSLQGDHAVKLMGWGQDDGIDYWLVANTWGYLWGMNGMFKIRRGINECEIESRITGGLPKV
ncbi:Cysteine peptidase, cysteine active site,Peptidase C1A, papain C-terminal,Cysteine peptidase [Cinara cedri]|uniref:Cysteine peptidase, cysteine active site,Peptidase C1A, papain C-terminal,Cysteine peptidase n=1 Tax=Cinara cedri TaxID=506608 RepID=A0A5E4MNZ4_9HEMI|nr:Cysteine peptidase, cysteine active site,Peptidase C1A, papain C-terminal,Cysteine peptidase [Cinara cedri]